MDYNKFTFLDLFAGIGGFRRAMEAFGGVSVGFSEIAKDAIEAYTKNYHDDNNLGDITKLTEVPYHDFMTAGVPCQSWSVAGKKLGFDDSRGQLWNDTIRLLKTSRPKAFIFENVKGLHDPRNKEALDYIMGGINDAGYTAKTILIDASDYGTPQQRERMYIIGFKDASFMEKFHIDPPQIKNTHIGDIMGIEPKGDVDFFQMCDTRDGKNTIHSWDIKDTTDRQKHICELLLKNRRKKKYGPLDGNPLSLQDFKDLDATITGDELDNLVDIGILQHKPHTYAINHTGEELSEKEQALASLGGGTIMVSDLKHSKDLRKKGASINRTLTDLVKKGVAICTEYRYDFKNSKNSTGIDGLYRIYMPSSIIFSTLTASDSNDHVATVAATTKRDFIQNVLLKKNYRKITKEEACKLQGFPADFILPPVRSKWMHLVGNSVSVNVVSMLVKAVVMTGVFEK